MKFSFLKKHSRENRSETGLNLETVVLKSRTEGRHLSFTKFIDYFELSMKVLNRYKIQLKMMFTIEILTY